MTDLHSHSFDFEADFTSDLRCIPMAVRRKLDLAGVKLKLSHWGALAGHERQRLVQWPDATARRSSSCANGYWSALPPWPMARQNRCRLR